MDDFSIESLYEIGIGLQRNKNSDFSENIDSVDGDTDSLAFETASLESFLDSANLYSRLMTNSQTQQLHLVQHINLKYGFYNRGLEKFCEKTIKSIESESDIAETNKSSDSEKDSVNSEQKTGFLTKVISAIKQFFLKIWDFIKSIFSHIKSFFKKQTQAQVQIIPELNKKLDRVIGVTERALKELEPKKDELTQITTAIETKLKSDKSIKFGNYYAVKIFIGCSKIYQISFSIVSDFVSAVNRSVGILSPKKQKRLAKISSEAKAYKKSDLTNGSLEIQFQTLCHTLDKEITSGIIIGSAVLNNMKNANAIMTADYNNNKLYNSVVSFLDGCVDAYETVCNLVNGKGENQRMISGRFKSDIETKTTDKIMGKKSISTKVTAIKRAVMNCISSSQKQVKDIQRIASEIEQLAAEFKITLKYDRSQQMFYYMSNILGTTPEKIEKVFSAKDEDEENE